VIALLLACTGAPDPLESAVPAARRAVEDASMDALRVGVQPYAPISFESLADWEALFAPVGDALGVPVSVVLLTDYGQGATLLEQGALDLAVLTPLSYVHAVDGGAALQLVASPIVNGTLTYRSTVFLLEDQAIRSVDQLSDLRGARFAFVSQHSASGFLYPAAALLAAGVHPDTDLDARFANSHDGVFDWVVDGQVLAGAVYDAQLDKGPIRRPDAPAVRVVGVSDRIPRDAWVLGPDVPPEVGPGLLEVLQRTDNGSESGAAVLAPLGGMSGLLGVDDVHYNGVRETLQRVRDAGVEGL
jgi:phosphonate transport system substrate-binding protein